MPPSANRRTRTRKIADLAERSDLDDVESTITPSRKRRKVNHESPAPVPTAESRNDLLARRQKTPLSEIKVYEEESSITEEDIDTAIRNLRTAKYSVQATVDYANALHEVAHPEGKEAYAKIAGNSWTFYVNELEIRIGRPPDERQPDGQQQLPDVEARMHDKSLVHIDLGPSKLVSRQHADIRYNEISGHWYITVTGRNGIKVDDIHLGRGQSNNLVSGNVIDVAGTQMMFVTPNVVPVIHPTILAQSHAQHEENDDDEDDNVTHAQPSLPSQRTPTRGSGSRSGARNRPPSSNDRYSNQQYSNSKQIPQSARSNSVMNDSVGDLQSSIYRAKASPSFSRVLMLESTEDIDYSQDTARDIKPPHSYAQLIGMAILSSPEEKLTLSKIYEWIKERYAFYRFSGGGWQNSIRHNLSLNKSFEKIARRTDEPGKGMKWQIVAEQRDDFLRKGLSSAKKSRGSSGPNSPTKMTLSMSTSDGDKRYDNPFLPDPPRSSTRITNPFVKTSPGSTPPMSHYPVAKEAYTPDRGGLALRHLHGLDPSSPRNTFLHGISPLPPYGNRARHHLSGFNEAAAAGSPGGPTMLLSSEAQDHLITPLITRHAPRLAPPSTAHLPSQFMPMSSPAPFWKYADFGSTPARHNVDISPVKMIMRQEPKKDQVGQENSLTDAPAPAVVDGKRALIRSSSPPVPEAELGSGSPTRALGNRGGEKAQSIQSQGPPPKLVLSDVHLLPRPNGAQPPNTIPRSNMANTIQQDEEEDEEEEGMIDLARGFQPIGSFHRNMNAGAIRGN